MLANLGRDIQNISYHDSFNISQIQKLLTKSRVVDEYHFLICYSKVFINLRYSYKSNIPNLGTTVLDTLCSVINCSNKWSWETTLISKSCNGYYSSYVTINPINQYL